MYRTRKRFAAAATIAALACAVSLSGQAAKPAPSDAARTPSAVLVELFTSEGCSSCPPADALLRQLNGTRTTAGQLIVGISEHVTYWNSLGWSDPFSSPVYTDRQNAYGEKFALDSVYTPQMVINGAQQIVGSDRPGLQRAFQKELEQPSRVSLHILSTSLDGSTLTITFSASGGAPVQGADVIAVLADDADQSSVLRGENSGRTISHVAVARSINHIGKLREAAQQTVKIAVPPTFQPGKAHHLILFAQAPGQGRVLGVDTRPL